MFDFSLEKILLTLPGIILGFALHEFGHAYAAHKLGDPTPSQEGRLTLSPFAHLDLFGLIFIMLMGFGWAKPVNTNPRYFKNPLRDQIIVSFAGPLTNLLIAAFFVVCYKYIPALMANYIHLPTVIGITKALFISSASINALLFVFNLLPIGPLDGFRILSGLLPFKYYKNIAFLNEYGTMILMGLILLSYIQIPILGGILNLLIGVPTGLVMLFLDKIIP